MKVFSARDAGNRRAGAGAAAWAVARTATATGLHRTAAARTPSLCAAAAPLAAIEQPIRNRWRDLPAGAVAMPRLHVGTRARALGRHRHHRADRKHHPPRKAPAARPAAMAAFSITPPASGPLSFLNPNALKAASEGSFRGQGNAAQQSRLNGAIAVTIAASLPQRHRRSGWGKAVVAEPGRRNGCSSLAASG
jgi:hypothetical protein